MSSWLKIRNCLYEDDLSDFSLFIENLSFKEPSIYVSGQNGKGKSTFLNLIAGYLEGSLKSIQWGNVFAGKRPHIAIVPQNLLLIPHLTVFQNIALPARVGKRKKEMATHKEILGYIQTLELKKYRDTLVSKLSLGQQQRVAVARALVDRPELLIADEPTASQDQHSESVVIQTIMDYVKAQSAKLILVSHRQYLRQYCEQSVDFDRLNYKEEERHVSHTHQATRTT